MQTGNLRVTLAFLGSVPERRLPELGELAARARPLRLAGRVAGGGPALARRLQGRLIGRGFAPDLKPFRPHVTVVRKVERPVPVGSTQPVVWQFTELALVASRTLPAGALYSVVESFSLCSGIKAANNSETP